MEVFIGNLAERVTLTELTAFLKAFASKARIRLIEKRQEDGCKIRYGLADFDSDKLALKAIKKLNQKALRGKEVVMREYFHRSYSNERRALNWRDLPWDGPERRRLERRKKENRNPKDNFKDMIREGEKKAEKEADNLQVSGYAHLARKG